MEGEQQEEEPVPETRILTKGLFVLLWPSRLVLLDVLPLIKHVRYRSEMVISVKNSGVTEDNIQGTSQILMCYKN